MNMLPILFKVYHHQWERTKIQPTQQFKTKQFTDCCNLKYYKPFIQLGSMEQVWVIKFNDPMGLKREDT